MRTFICKLLAISVLFMSAEGSWEVIKEVHPHQENLVSQVDADTHVPTDPDPLSDDDGIQCEHLCHGHSTSIVGQSLEFVSLSAGHYPVFDAAAFPTRSQAPPTPPPNA